MLAALARSGAGSYADPHGKWVELGRMWGDSIYTCLVSGGAPEAVADTAQVAGTLPRSGSSTPRSACVCRATRRSPSLLACTILAAPHSSLADTVLLATAAALWSGEAAQRRASLAKWTLALALWLTPLFNPPLVSPPGRLTPLLDPGLYRDDDRSGRSRGRHARAMAAPSAPGGLAAEE